MLKSPISRQIFRKFTENYQSVSTEQSSFEDKPYVFVDHTGSFKTISSVLIQASEKGTFALAMVGSGIEVLSIQ